VPQLEVLKAFERRLDAIDQQQGRARIVVEPVDNRFEVALGQL
jgi:hypothetical protein